MTKIKDKILAEITNIIGIFLLKKSKKEISKLIEATCQDIELSSILKNLIKNYLHSGYEDVCISISKYADDKEDYWGYLFKLEEETKKKKN